MTSTLCITFRFFQPLPLFHGRGDDGIPEWPPSPARVYQALVNAASLRCRGRALPPDVEAALMLIESIRPSIVAPDAIPSTNGYRAYVPHNQTDLITAAWHRGNVDAGIASYRVEKDIRPMRINHDGQELPELHYVFPLGQPIEDCRQLLNVIRPCVRSISALGWGIDLVAADATLLPEDALAEKPGQRWQLAVDGRHRLRVQREGSLQSLRQRHDSFLRRLTNSEFSEVPPFTAVDVLAYVRETDPVPRPHAVFKLVDEDDDTFRYPHAKLIHIAGMVRHVAIERMKSDPPPWIEDPFKWLETFVGGHRGDAQQHQQLSYVPLPSIGHAHADAMIRNVMIIAPPGMDRELAYLSERLNGEALRPEGDFGAREDGVGPLSSQRIEFRHFIPARGRFIDACYLGVSQVWETVTPVILDGHNDKKPGKTVKLIQAALQRAGIEAPCEFTWQSVPFLRNCLSAHKYDRDGRHTGYHRPAHLKDRTAVHVRLTFEHPIPGPITLGAGRHCGFGLMAACSRAT